jgi:hypothetical protein
MNRTKLGNVPISGENVAKLYQLNYLRRRRRRRRSRKKEQGNTFSLRNAVRSSKFRK